MGATQSTNHPHTHTTPLGKLAGVEQRDSSDNPVCYRYLRVPYALPPIGKLRWRRPQPLPDDVSFDSPSGSPGDYTSFGPVCPQPSYPINAVKLNNPSAATPIENIQSEDCLYLNIWVPAFTPAPGGWPVQFHIHGGWLQIGNACQEQDEDPFDVLLSSYPRIIVCPTYRLNLFGFLAGADLARCAEDPAPSNYGFWDQRCALEWTAKHISLFGGNPNNITVGGLSAGANSTVFQLYHDAHLPAPQRLIKRIYLWSNAVAIQPAPSTSANLTAQFNDLCTAHAIPSTLSATEKLSRLRTIPSEALMTSLPTLSRHTFRASTDDDFIPSSFLKSLHNGAFTTLLSSHNTSVLISEVRDEYQLYKLVNPPHDHSSMLTQLKNYYPEVVVHALLSSNLYPLPAQDSTDSDAYADTFARMIADVQVHASLRSLTHLLLNPPTTSDSNVKPLPPQNLHRFRICWRAKSLDAWLKPESGMFHASDTPIWWLSGLRAGFTFKDRVKAEAILEPFGEFLYGREGKGVGGEDRIRLLDEEGAMREDVLDEEWERGMRVAEVVWEAQKDGV